MKVGCGARARAGGREASVEVDRELHCQEKCPVIPQI